MAYVHEIKFFKQDDHIYAALYDQPTPIGEFWIKNLPATEIGIDQLPSNVDFEKKYPVQALGIKPFPVSKPLFDFIDVAAKVAWEKGAELAMKAVFPNS